jgi:hypothetical protein
MRYLIYFKGVGLNMMDNHADSKKFVTLNQQVSAILQHWLWYYRYQRALFLIVINSY